MIHDAVLHLLNEQPLLIDIFQAPSPSDTVIICTNLRTMGRTRPIFADHLDSTFVFPYAQVRFVELPTGASASAQMETALVALAAEPEVDLELDEDFLRRIRDL